MKALDGEEQQQMTELLPEGGERGVFRTSAGASRRSGTGEIRWLGDRGGYFQRKKAQKGPTGPMLPVCDVLMSAFQ